MENGVSIETRAKIQADEQRALLKKALGKLGYVVVTGLLWMRSGSKTGDIHFFWVGISALPAISTLWQWSLRRNLDPVEAANRPLDGGTDFDEKTALKGALTWRKAYVTYAMVAILVIIGLLQMAVAPSIEQSIRAAGLVKSSAAAGEWWRLISATYLHGGLMHIYGNAFALLVLGSTMEAFVPRWHLPVVYAISGITGSIASLLLLSATSVGASGAILGLGGYLLTVGLLEPTRLPKGVRMQALVMIALTAYTGAFGFRFIDNAAHFGGALGGAFAAWVLTPTGEDRTGIVPRQWTLAGAIACAFILASAFGTGSVLAHARSRTRPVMSDSIRLVDGRNPELLIENDSDRALEAYRFNVKGGGQLLASGWRDDCCFGAASSMRPIAPHSVARLALRPVAGGVTLGPPKAQITLAVFDDGSFEGSRQEFDELVKQRKFVADDAAYWRSVIYQQQNTDFKMRFRAFNDAFDSQRRSSALAQPAGEALGIPELIFAAGSNPDAYASVSASAVRNLDAAERALRTRLAAPDAAR
jgi:membrane associated rhomboid family serine protease